MERGQRVRRKNATSIKGGEKRVKTYLGGKSGQDKSILTGGLVPLSGMKKKRRHKKGGQKGASICRKVGRGLGNGEVKHWGKKEQHFQSS